MTKKSILKRFKPIIAVAPIIIGVLFFQFLVKTKPTPKSAEEKQALRKIRFVKAESVKLQMIATGYGNATSSRDWTAFSEVKGKIISVGCRLFQQQDILDGQGFYKSLQQTDKPLGKKLQQKLQVHLANVTPKNFTEALVFGLNRILLEERIFGPVKEDYRNNDRLLQSRQNIEKLGGKFFKKDRYPHAIKDGQFLRQGMVVCQIDPTEYNLVVEQKQISIRQQEIQIVELQKELEHLSETVILEEKRAKLLQGEYRRQENLQKTNVSSISETEKALNDYLTQLNRLKDIQNQISVLPLQINNTKASLALAKSELAQAKIDLGKTVIYAPFDLRITNEDIEQGQVVSVGQELLQGYGIEAAEVIGQFQMHDFSRAFPVDKMKSDFRFRDQFDKGFEPFFKRFRIPARVHLAIANVQNKEEQHWDGYFSRIAGSVSSSSQTVSGIVTVPEPYEKTIPGVRPPLVKGMYCKVTLLGPKVEGFCLPRSCYQNERLLVLKDGKLAVKKIKPTVMQEDYVIFQKGLQAGEQIILTDIFPAITGMQLSGIDVSDEIRQAYPWFVERKEQP